MDVLFQQGGVEWSLFIRLNLHAHIAPRKNEKLLQYKQFKLVCYNDQKIWLVSMSSALSKAKVANASPRFGWIQQMATEFHIQYASCTSLGGKEWKLLLRNHQSTIANSSEYSNRRIKQVYAQWGEMSIRDRHIFALSELLLYHQSSSNSE